MPQRLLQMQLEGRLFGSFLVCIDLCCAIGLCVVLPRGLLTAVRYGSLTVFRFNYSTAKEAWRDQGTYMHQFPEIFRSGHTEMFPSFCVRCGAPV